MTTFQKFFWAAIFAAAFIALWAMGPEPRPETAGENAARFRARQVRLLQQEQAKKAIEEGMYSLP